MKLTNKQKECLDAIINFKNQYQYSPTVRELCKMMNIKSTSTIHNRLTKLREKGYIDWLENQNRTIRVLKGENK